MTRQAQFCSHADLNSRAFHPARLYAFQTLRNRLCPNDRLYGNNPWSRSTPYRDRLKRATMKVRERLNAVLLHPFTLPNHLGSDPSGHLPLGSQPGNEYSKKTGGGRTVCPMQSTFSRIENESENQKTGAQAGAQFSSRVRILSILKVLRYHPRRTKSLKISL